VENGVGKLTAPEKGAPNVSMGKRDWRTPIPHLSLFDRKVGQGLIVLEILLVPRDPNPNPNPNRRNENETGNEKSRC
jgi:hypothetical protein